MIEYYTAKSLGGNTRKVSIMLAETGLPHTVSYVDLNAGEQHQPWYRAINPNGKIPAIVDPDADDLRLGESGAILAYLADKSGRFLPAERAARAKVLQWVFWQVGGIGPMFGQWSYFASSAPEKAPFAIERYRTESARLIGVLDEQLRDHEYVAGDYSIADMALYSWIRPGVDAFARREPEQAPAWAHVRRWLDLVGARPAVKLCMTRYEGSAVRVARDVPNPL